MSLRLSISFLRAWLIPLVIVGVMWGSFFQGESEKFKERHEIALKGWNKKVERATGETVTQFLKVLDLAERELKVWVYRDFSRKDAWYSDRELSENFYFLMPKEVWVNEWDKMCEADVVMVPSHDTPSFYDVLDAKEGMDVRRDPAYRSASISSVMMYVKRSLYTDEKRKRWKLFKDKSDPGIDGLLVWKVSKMLLGLVSVFLVGFYLLNRLNQSGLLSLEWESGVFRVLSAVAIGSIVLILLLMILGFFGMDLSGVCWGFLGVGVLMFILELNRWFKKNREPKAVRIYVRDLISVNSLSWAAMICLIVYIGFICFSKPVDDYAALWIHAVRAKLFYVYDSYGSWYYSGDDWAVTRQNYPVGFSLLGTYFTIISGGWHERAIWFLPWIGNVFSLLVFFTILKRKMHSLIAVSICSVLFLSQWFSWMQLYFYPLSFLAFYMLVGATLMQGWSVYSSNKGNLFLGSVVLAGMGLMKNEGIVLFIVLILGFVLSDILTRKMNFTTLMDHGVKKKTKAFWSKKWVLFAWRYIGGGIILLPWILISVSYRPRNNTMELSRVLRHSEETARGVLRVTNEWLEKELFHVSTTCYSGAYWAVVCGSLMWLGCFVCKRRLFSRESCAFFLPVICIVGLYLVFNYTAFLSSMMEPLHNHLISLPRLWLPYSMFLLLWVSQFTYKKMNPMKR